jgi:hypothetical protein
MKVIVVVEMEMEVEVEMKAISKANKRLYLIKKNVMHNRI